MKRPPSFLDGDFYKTSVRHPPASKNITPTTTSTSPVIARLTWLAGTAAVATLYKRLAPAPTLTANPTVRNGSAFLVKRTLRRGSLPISFCDMTPPIALFYASTPNLLYL